VSVRIRVRNFQSIEDAEVEVSGLTVVTGQNNSGKTALMRAVRGVFDNTGGDAFVRHGTDALAVHLDFGDADVTWTKGPKVKPTYVVGGKTINPGRAVPSEVASLGITPVQAGSGEVWPQVAPQFTGQLFLLDLPGSSIAEVVSDVDRVSRLTEALRYADSDKRTANADLKVRRKDRDDAATELAAFDGLDAAGDVVDNAARTLADVEDASDELDGVRTLAEGLRASSSRVDALDGVGSVVVPDPAPIHSASVELEGVRRVADAVRRHRSTVASLPSDVPVPETVGVVDCAREVRDVRVLAGRIRSARNTVASVPSVAVPDVTDPSDVSREVSDLRVVARRLSTARALVVRYGVVPSDVPDSMVVDRVATARTVLGSMRERVASARGNVSDLEDRLGVAVAERDAAQVELDAVIREVGACPTCGSATDGGGVHHHQPTPMGSTEWNS